MLRSRPALAALVGIGLALLFAVFIAFRSDTALIGALSAAGTVAAGLFAAVAALASMRAAVESGVTARQARAALARTARPRLRPGLTTEGGRLIGTVACAAGPSAVDVTVVWTRRGAEPVVERTARLDPAESLAVDLRLPDTADASREITMLWLEYEDEDRVGHWQDTWQVGTGPHDRGALRPTESRLVD